jgi:hypothetical protein
MQKKELKGENKDHELANGTNEINYKKSDVFQTGTVITLCTKDFMAFVDCGKPYFQCAYHQQHWQ